MYSRKSFENIIAEHKKHDKWLKVVLILVSIVVFWTTYAMILPAISWDKMLICEVMEHTHDDTCYDLVQLSEEKELTCGIEAHVHGEACYELETVCGLEASEDHVHDETCFEEVLICCLPEHSHLDACYHVIQEAREERVLTCGLEEHIHTDACFDAPPAAEPAYFCGLSEHVHGADCYFEDGNLRCTIPVHSHDASCLSYNVSADIAEANPELLLVSDTLSTEKSSSLAEAKAGTDTALAAAETEPGSEEYTQKIKEESLGETAEEPMLLSAVRPKLLAAAAPVSIGGNDGNGEGKGYWYRVTSLSSDPDAYYLIVSIPDNGTYVPGQFVPGVDSSGVATSTAAGFSQVLGAPEFYTSDVGSSSYVRFVPSGSGRKIAFTQGGTTYYAKAGSSLTFGVGSGGSVFHFEYQSAGYWWIYYTGENNNYLRYHKGNTIKFGTGTDFNGAYRVRRNLDLYQHADYLIAFRDGSKSILTVSDDGETLNDRGFTLNDYRSSSTKRAVWQDENGTLYLTEDILERVNHESAEYTFVEWQTITEVTLKPGFEGAYTEENYTVPVGSSLGELPSFECPVYVRDGYTFLGWSPDDGKTLYTSEELSALSITEYTDFTAQWTNCYTVSFDCGIYSDNIEPIAPAKVLFTDAHLSDLPYPFWVQGDPLTFEGWYTDSDLTGLFDGTVNADMTLYAKFGSNEGAYYVYYCDFERTEGEKTVLYTIAVSEGEPAAAYSLYDTPVPDGKLWDGQWYLDDTYTVPYVLGTPVSNLPDEYLIGEAGRDVYLYPGITNAYRLIFITNGNRISPMTVATGETIDISELNPEREGYTFTGWYLDETLETPVPDNKITVTKDTRVYAGWIPNYVPFTATLHTENADDTGFTSADILSQNSNWYALAGSTVFTKTSGTTHTVWCRLNGEEYPVFSERPVFDEASGTYVGTQAVLADVYEDYFLYNDADTDLWQNHMPEGSVPYSTVPVLPNGTTIIAFDYMRARVDLSMQIKAAAGSDNGVISPGMDFEMMRPYCEGGVINEKDGVYSGVIDGIRWELIPNVDVDGTLYYFYYLRDVKYNQLLGAAYPANNWFKLKNSDTVVARWKFLDRTGGNNQVSKVLNLTSALIKDTSDLGRNTQGGHMEALLEAPSIKAIMYALQSFPNEEPDFYVDGTGYIIDRSYSQILNYSSTSFSTKTLTGATAVQSSFNFQTDLVGYTVGVDGKGNAVTYQQIFEKYKSDFGIPENETVTNNTWKGAVIELYKRNMSSIVFDFLWDSDGNDANDQEEYSVYYNQSISDYRFGMPEMETHPSLERPGYRFVGWANEYGEVYSDEDWQNMRATIDSKNGGQLMFFAKWEPETNNVIEFYEDAVHTTPYESHTFNNGEYISVPATLNPDLGWVWTSSDLGRVSSYHGDIPMYGEYGVRGKHELFGGKEGWIVRVYGLWSASAVQVIYDADAASCGLPDDPEAVPPKAPSDSTLYTYGQTSVPVNDLVSTGDAGKIFVGWKLTENGQVYQPGNHVNVLWKPTMTFTAQWAEPEKVVRLRYASNYPHPDGTAEPTQVYYPGTHQDEGWFLYPEDSSANVWDNLNENGTDHFVYDHYHMIGWNTEPDGSGEHYDIGDAIELDQPFTTLYAEWRIDEVELAVYKRLVGSDDSRKFHFALELSEGTFVDHGRTDYSIEGDGKKVTFALRKNESVKIFVPRDAEITLEELDDEGFYVEMSETGTDQRRFGEKQTLLMDQNREITVFNQVGRALPATGGSGRHGIKLLGAVMMVCAVLFLTGKYYRRKK